MAKFANDAVMDAALDQIKNNGKVISVCSGQPTGYDDGFLQKGGGGRMLAKVTVSAGSFTGPVNGDTSGRKLTVNAHSGITVSATGGGNHVAVLSSAAASTLYYVTTATSQSLTSGNSLTINGWDIEIADPS